MAIAAMSNVTHVEKREIASLQSKFREVAARAGNPTIINRTEFTECLSIVGINPSDSDIFDKLFTMYDKTGDDQILWKDFVVGIAPLISGSHVDKIDFALRLYDVDGTSTLRGIDIINVLSQMNRVASYFGDPVMSEDQIVTIVSDIIDMSGNTSEALATSLHYPDYVKLISDHPIVNTFIAGGGTVQYGMGR